MKTTVLITKEEADKILSDSLKRILERLRKEIDEIKAKRKNGRDHCSLAQLTVFRKRQITLQKNFNFYKRKYDMVMHNRK